MTSARVDDLLRARIGLDPPSLGPAAVGRAVAGRMRARGLTSAAEYAGLAAADPAEWDALVAELVVPETWFFRGGRDLFDHLARWATTRPRPVRVLSAPCSTGEEAYSVAVAFAEAGLKADGYSIDGVDLSADAVRRAEAGVYPTFSFREPGPDPRPAYFAPVAGGRWAVAERFRAGVRYRVGNLAAADFLAGEPPFDLVFCRNVLIYLTAAARFQVVQHLDRLLAPDGLLVMTPAEADGLPAARFAPAGPAGYCLYQKVIPAVSPPPPSSAGRSDSAPAPRSTDRPGPASPPPSRAAVTTPDATPGPDPFAAAWALADAGRLDEARAACEQVLAAGPSAAGYALLGVIHQAAGRPAAAAEAFRKALYLDPEQPDARAQVAAGRGSRPS